MGLAGLMILVYRIFTISLPAFTKDFSLRDVFGYREIQKFEYSPDHCFGVPFMDAFIQSLTASDRHLYYPILLISEFNAPGLEIAKDFLAEGLRRGEGAVYLSFTRPWDIIVKQISKRVDRSDASNWERGFTIIDCYSKLYLRKRMRVSPEVRKSVTVRFCDPRDTLQVNKTYKDCLSTTQKRGFSEARALYDSLSDFLAISDPELVVSYLRHSIVWEELRCVKAMYLLWPEVLSEPIDDTYLSWFINTSMKIKVAETGYSASVEGVLPSPHRFDLTWDLKIASGTEHGKHKTLKR
jgi:hypothetical protein